MNKVELNVMELLEYLEEILENAPKVPITGKAMIDTKEFEEVIEQIRNYLPDELKKAKCNLKIGFKSWEISFYRKN